MNTAAQKIANGDLDVLLTCHSHDEIVTLSESFRQTVAHLKHYIDYINNLAYRDLLTGVKNRTAYLEAGTKMDEMIRLKKPEFALAVFDVNNLKAVNDALGHEFGDVFKRADSIMYENKTEKKKAKS